MVSGPNLNETSIVSGGYGGAAEGIIPTSSIKGKEHSNGSKWCPNLILTWSSIWVMWTHLHLCWRICLGPAVRFNPEYFDRRCGNTPKPGVCACMLTWQKIFFLFFFSLSLSVKCVCQHFNSKRLALFYRVWGQSHGGCMFAYATQTPCLFLFVLNLL